MDPILERAHEQIMHAHIAEDLFGAEDVVVPFPKLKKHLEAQYTPLFQATEVEGYHGEDREAALEARERLSELWDDALSRANLNLYGLPRPGIQHPPHVSRSFTVGPRTYYVGAKDQEDDFSSLIDGYLELSRKPLGEVMYRVANDPTHNSLVEQEGRILYLLHSREVPQWKHLPIVLDRFTTNGRAGLVLRKINGHTLAWLRSRPQHRAGLDQRDMIWMLDRTLSVLGYVHRCGIVHGAIRPDAITVQHLSHNAILTDWQHAVHRPAESGARVSVSFPGFSAPEVQDPTKVGPWSDIFALGKTIIWLLGGNPETNEIPQRVERPLADFLHRMVEEEVDKRPDDAWSLYQEQVQIKNSLWAKKFRALDVT